MKITWLGQAGLLFETDGMCILIDPYLSDSIAKAKPTAKRRVAVDNKFLKIKPNVIILTHNHLDHTDIETLKHYLSENSNVVVLASKNAWEEVCKLGGNNNYVLFNRHSEWTAGNVKFSAVKAEHSDEYAIGIIIEHNQKLYYITGDTLFNTDIFEDLPKNIFAAFLPINGKGNNMNMTDAERFAKRINAKRVVPLHFGMFDDLNPKDFICNNKVIPEIYKEIEL